MLILWQPSVCWYVWPVVIQAADSVQFPGLSVKISPLY